DMKNDDVDPLTVSFYTKNVTVQLKDAAGLPLEDDIEVKYNAGGWQDFGTSSEGAVSAELLPKTYNFRLYYKGRYVQQNADVINPETMVNFQTGQVVSLSDTAVLVNSGGWIEFLQNMELLPGNYKFKFDDNHRATYTIDAGFINTIE
ncbi:hypothetical protein K8I31_03330, partial [bacterium]|nr:hypothetical protein [bacterium]